MATHAKKAPAPRVRSGGINPLLVPLPEGANQTITLYAPVVLTGGYVVEAADPATNVLGFAYEAGHNDAAAGTSIIKVLPMIDGVEIFLNFLGDAGVNNALAAADLGGSFELQKDATGLWHAADKGVAGALKLVSFETDSEQAVPNHAAAADVNARCVFTVLSTIRSWG